MPLARRRRRTAAHRDFELLDASKARRLAELLGVKAPAGEHVSLAELFNPSDAPAFFRPSAPRRAMDFHTLLQT